MVRTQRGLTREELARKARGYGLRWHGTTVTEIEAGRRHLRLEQLLLLALALDASPADFVAGDEPVHLTADARVGARTVRGLLAGRLDDDAPRDVLDTPQTPRVRRCAARRQWSPGEADRDVGDARPHPRPGAAGRPPG